MAKMYSQIILIDTWNDCNVLPAVHVMAAVFYCLWMYLSWNEVNINCLW